MSPDRTSPIGSLRRRMASLVALGLLTTVLCGGILWGFERSGSAVRSRVADFHGPTLVSVQEALLALGQLRLESMAPTRDEDVEAVRVRRRLLNEIEQPLERIVALQRTYRFEEAASIVSRVDEHLRDVHAALAVTNPPLPSRLTVLNLTLDQLRLLHQAEQTALLSGQAARSRMFYLGVLPLLSVCLAVGATLTWLIWRSIDQTLATETALRDGLLDEIHERRQVEAELRLKDTAIATSNNGIVIADAEGAIVYANPAFLAMWRIADPVALTTLSTAHLWHVETAEAGPIETPDDAGWSGEVTAVCLDGSRFPALLTSTAVRDDEGKVTHVMASFVDLTEARAVQSQLIQSQKLESVGRLAGGVAHDFNNLLLVIKGYVEMASAEVEPESALGRDLSQVARAADSAAALTAQMLTFSRRQIIAPAVLDMNAVVHHIHGMLHRVLGEDITLRVDTASDLWRVRFDPGQAEQILLNLAANARDAMPAGGQLTIETTNVRLDEEYVREHPGVLPGEYVMLAVSDTGAGMTPEIMMHAFEPFFTTKVLGHGTGLGLAIIHGAVSQNGGRIELYSEPGHGTTFKIYLPRTREAEMPAVEAPPMERPRGHETIMVVEDDQPVRTLAKRLLERQGYTVHAFADPSSAIDWLRTSAQPVHLLFTDVIMPGMDGKELAARVVALRPGLRVLYVSGYTANVIVMHGVLKPGVEFLAKPYTQEALAAKVRQVLDSPAA